MTTPATGARDVLGARVGGVTEVGDVVAHAELEFDSGRITVSDPMESEELAAPTPGAALTYSLALYVPNVDEVVDAAIEVGATVREPVVDFVTGDRFGSIIDPFGVRWAVMTRVSEWAKTQG